MNLTRVEKLEKIIQLNALLNRSDNFNNILNIILKETEKIFNVEGTSILLKDEETGNLHFYVVTGKKKDELNSIQMKHGEGVCGHVFQSGEPLIENNPEESNFFSNKVDKETNFQTLNLLAVPLNIDDKKIGVLELVNKTEGDFTQDDLDFLEFVATQISITLERARSVEEKIKSERLASIGETVASLSHCIKNILHGFQGGATIIEMHLNKLEKNNKIIKGWEIIKPNIERVSDLAMGMLEYSKERPPDYQKININSIINNIIQLKKHHEEYKNITIDVDLELEQEAIDIDPDRIFRCFLNIYSNALDATLNKTDGLISVSTKKQGSFIEIEFKDNGIGIEKDHIDKLFTKFFSTKGSKGTGLGLPTSHKIITEHKGTVSIESEIDVGTSVIIQLPIHRI